YDAPNVIADNLIRDVGPFGIEWLGGQSTLEIRGNGLRNIVGSGITGAFSSRPESARIYDNTIQNVSAADSRTVYGIQVPGAVNAEVRANAVTSLGYEPGAAARAGIILSGCRIVQVTDNVVTDIGPDTDHTGVVF